MEPLTKLRRRLLLHQFCMTLLSERGESNKTNENKVSYEAPLTRKTRFIISIVFSQIFVEKWILGFVGFAIREWLFGMGTIFSKSLVTYRKVANSNTSCLEAHVGFFRWLMKGISDPYVLWLFDKKLIFWLVTALELPTIRYVHLCYCKSIAKIVSIPKNYIWYLNPNEWQILLDLFS